MLALLLQSAGAPGQERPVPSDGRWAAIHQEAFDALTSVSRESFRQATLTTVSSDAQQLVPELPRPWMVVVGFTGGIEGKDSSASGVVALREHVKRHIGQGQEVLPLTFNNFYWRHAAAEVVEVVRQASAGQDGMPRPPPLIVVYGHSWGGGSISKFARELRKYDLGVALAIYIDAFTFRNPRLPENIRYAVNFYQRGGILFGLPFRGKSKLIPRDPEKTRVLGSYRIRPVTKKWGWSWNFLQPLLYRHHHRIGHDLRLQQYLLGIVSLKLPSEQDAATAAAQRSLFERVVILGASVSAEEKAPSPGRLLSRHAGTPEENIHILARGGAKSSEHLSYLDNVTALRPTLIVALDLFYHDFKASLFLTESRKKYLRDYIARLHASGAVVVVGNIPSLVLLRHGHVNRYLDELAKEFPNLVLVDAEGLLDEVGEHGLPVEVNGKTILLTRDDLFADRVHLNLLGSTAMANLIQQDLLLRFPALWPKDAPRTPLPLEGLVNHRGVDSIANQPALAPQPLPAPSN